MSNPIPPFVCNTPPPIDCIADAPPPLVEDDFGDFAVVDDHQFEVSSLPVTPVHVAKLPDVTSSTNKIASLPTTALSNAAFDFPLKDVKEGTTVDINSFEHDNPSLSLYPPPAPSKSEVVKDDLPYIIEANSPPPFEYAPEDDELPPCDELEDDEEVDEFPADDDMGKYDDNISLPSLKFDSLSNHSKSTTPVSEELTKPKLEEESETISIVDEVTNNVISEINLTEEESTEKLSTPDEEELNTVPIGALNIRDELEKCHDTVVTSITNEEQDDDFAEFETFPPAPSLSNDINQTNEEPPDDSDPQTKEIIQENNTEPIFEADFSQFSSFATEVEPPSVSSQIIENSKLIEKSTLDDLEADDFDDFQDFTINTSTTSTMEQRKASVYSASSEVEEVAAEEPSEATKNSEQEDDDDDFGEFSEVVESNEASSIPLSNSGFNLANLNDKLKPILEMMFPVSNPSEEEAQEEYTPSALNDLNQLTAISQIDTAKALELQWINSEARHSLIKSLGVDSRNILYGEKWNSSMPRFAANLSFNPLEPMKPDKSANSTTSDYRKRSENPMSSSTTSKIDVPAVEFDWNSSGLVNPLDASQAHTLLLDLDQLVVVANLDKINLDSSRSSPCFATPSPSSRSSSSSLISTLQTTIKTDAPATLPLPPPPPALDAIDVKQPRTNNIDLITMSSPSSLSSSSTMLLLPPPLPLCNPSIYVTGTCRTKKCLNDFDKPTNDYVTNNANFTTTTTTTNIFANLGSNDHNFNQYLDFRVKEILHERTIEAVHTTQPGESDASTYQQSSTVLQSNNNNSNNNNNVYDTDKSLRCFINDEEAISTPIEFKSNADAPIAISTATTATAIITTPTTLPGDYIDITCGDFQPGILETDLDTVITTTTQVLNHNTTHSAKYQESLKTDLETESQQHSGVVSTSTYAGPLKETHIFTPSKGESVQSSRLSTSSSKISRTSESKCPIDFDYEIAAAGIIIDETVVKKEYRDVEYNPGFGSKYREDPIENTIHRLSPEGGSSKISYLNSEHANRIDRSHNQLEESSDLQDKFSEKKNSFVPKSNSFDEEFSDFQSVPPPAPAPVPVRVPVPVPVPALATSTIVPSTSTIIPSSAVADPKTSPSHWRVLKEASEVSSLGSRTGTPVSLSDEMILCPAILLPQAIQMESKPKIEWPEPGINPEELARIEELFPQPKGNGSGSNKPSPSHSGRSQKQLGSSNRATPQLGAADDDDWSDFVSVPAAASNHIQSISQQFQKRQISPAKSVAEQNNDEEWSDFVYSAPQHPNNMRPSASILPQFNSASWQNANFYNNPMSAYASPPTSFYYQPPAQPQPQQQHQHQQQQQNLSNNLVPNLSNVNNNTAPAANNNIINNNSINQYLINNQANHLSHHHQQHIQMMRDFSSASPMDGGSISSSTTPSMHQQYPMQLAPGYGYNRGIQQQQHGKSSQFGSGSSKIAPSISLIPDLGFVAPAHTSFISVPKNSFATKK